MAESYSGTLRKMRVEAADPVRYRMPVGDALYPVDEKIGQELRMEFSGNIYCINCNRLTKKSFSQGYCFPCFKTLAECDMCIMRPENCHHHLGTCRDEKWAEGHCMQPHFVYLANSSGLKVGITRGNQIPTRWIDQGATQAIPMFKVKNRFHSGLIEAAVKKQVSDRTDWRKLLKGAPEPVDLVQAREGIVSAAQQDLDSISASIPDFEFEQLDDTPVELVYPVESYPEKITSFNFDKTPSVAGTLMGIKGQYLILDGGVINIRKFTGYEVAVS